MWKYKEEYKLDKSETIGETDHTFDLENYLEWLEEQLTECRKQLSIANVGSSSIDRKHAEFLWELLDDIDTAGDMFKPRDLDSWERYYSWINKKLRKRFEVFKSDGYKLMTPEEYQEYNEKRTKEMIALMQNQPLRFNSSE